ncbi:hypothetical protein O6P43_000080 [Quillaja saponaria]|uniref:Uncharacterized protein n=1 Tax=Quillaja saponaria TaxID=32244 RepID=A0AAD7VLV0_QUISA|nr:hypothetical protein O6P43_000080 [Quillaja saponaria]
MAVHQKRNVNLLNILRKANIVPNPNSPYATSPVIANMKKIFGVDLELRCTWGSIPAATTSNNRRNKMVVVLLEIGLCLDKAGRYMNCPISHLRGWHVQLCIQHSRFYFF